ncbi:MAG TPA: hypothetical protein DHV25_01355 [Candidatus Kerfeldbacteria bacterium]|nr:hypothetical protein [Candidatus Kerfeldbacteria bacterium]
MHERRFSSLFALIMVMLILLVYPVLGRLETHDQLDTSLDSISLTADVSASALMNSGYAAATLWPSLPTEPTTPDEQPVAEIRTDIQIPNDLSREIRKIHETSYAVSAAGSAGGIDDTPQAYEAVEVARAFDTISDISPDNAFTFWVEFKNTGTATWYNTGNHFVALNVTNPSGRTSKFEHPWWRASYRPTIMQTPIVRPGDVGRFVFALKTPEDIGIYHESFHLVAENLTWIKGGQVTVPIGVGKRVSAAPHWKAREIDRSNAGTITMEPGKAITIWVDIQNKGSVPWFRDDEHFVAANVTNPVGRESTFWHPYWREIYRPAKLFQRVVRPGETGRFYIALQAPTMEGLYSESFQLVAEGLTWIPGGHFTIPIQVGNPVNTQSKLPGEPVIRVGLFSTSDPVVVTSNQNYEIWQGANKRLASKQSYATSTTTSANGTYNVNGTSVLSGPIRFVPTSTSGIMEIASFKNHPAWNTALNDNTFRGIIEINYVAATSQTWVINELPLEAYLRGVAESSNGSPAEYLQALAVAERSYTLWHYLNGGKYKIEGFTVNATTDQVYRGYGFEARSVDPEAAVKSTTGVVVTVKSAASAKNPRGVVFTPYSSGTDGRTRSWSEVWSGSYSWLISVNDPYGIIGNARTLSGNHMVGMSAKGALGYAANEQRTFHWILEHYYTGITIEKVY